MKIFFQTICGATCDVNPLTTLEWYVAFTCCSIVMAQLPNLNSIAGVSLIGAITAILYCTLIWVVSISKRKPIEETSDVERLFRIFNALGIIGFAFRGHNLVLEIQVN